MDGGVTLGFASVFVAVAVVLIAFYFLDDL